ncbi:MAG: hypothetical protein OJJ54_17870 [Pseudonocardia sp.]|nr:hypothetical protein [Pseudonocardia sp.]
MTKDEEPELMSVAQARAILGEDRFEAIRAAPKKPLTPEQVDFLVGVFRRGEAERKRP